jgi:hypothetical protein
VTALGESLQAETGGRLVERAVLDELLEELKLGTSALTDPATALRLGRVLSARFVVTGSVTTSAGEVRVTARVIETETSLVAGSVAHDSPASTPMRAVAGQVGKELARALRRAHPLRARVLEGGADEVIPDVGTVHGATPGLRLELIRERRSGHRQVVAAAELVDVQERRSRARLVARAAPVEAGVKAQQVP